MILSTTHIYRRHGKFRPTLMKLVSSNDAETVAETIQQAMDVYWKDQEKEPASASAAALAAISKLKGIGPATASLLLSVHNPDRVIFFSDEAFWWLCCAGQKGAPIKYTPKEYYELSQAAQTLVERLKVSAIDVEKVAYVIMKDEAIPVTAAEKSMDAKKAAAVKNPGESKASNKSKTVDEEGTRKSSTKRKKDPRHESPERPVRRSKRGKQI